MSHSLSKIWIHLIFGTKNRLPLMKPSFEKDLYKHIKSLLEFDFKCKVEIINGTSNHLHILMLQNPQYSITEIVKNIKGNSSHWINQSKFISTKFAWQTGYGVFSVSQSKIKAVVNYIEKQKDHHKKISFEEELNKFEIIHGLQTAKIKW